MSRSLSDMAIVDAVRAMREGCLPHDGAVLHANNWRTLPSMLTESRLCSASPNRSGLRYGKQGGSVSFTLSTLEGPVRRADQIGS